MWSYTINAAKRGYLVIFKQDRLAVSEMEVRFLPKGISFTWGELYPPSNIKEQAIEACHKEEESHGVHHWDRE